jgi:hypothetical protein
MITLDEFKEKDLCFEYYGELYDYNLLDDFVEDICESLSCENDPVELDIAYQNEIKKAKHIAVFTKEYFKMPAGRIKSEIQGYVAYNWDTEGGRRDICYSDKAEEYLQKFLKEVEEFNKIWRPVKKMGYIDLSKEVEKYIREEYGDNE